METNTQAVKMDLSDFRPLFDADPAKLSDQELLSLDFLLHQAIQLKKEGHWIRQGETDWKMEDLVQHHRHAETELKRRGFNHHQNEAHDVASEGSPGSKAGGLEKGDKPKKKIDYFENIVLDEDEAVKFLKSESGLTKLNAKPDGDRPTSKIDKSKTSGEGWKFWDLFSGAGLFSKGLSTIGTKPTLAIEFEPWHAKTYAANFSETPVLLKNIRKVDFNHLRKGLGKPDFIIGGIPCEGFSRARADQTKSVEQNSLYKSFLRAVEAADPEAIAVEEVPEFLTAYSEGRSLVKQLRKLGYSVSCGIVSSMLYGSAQDRRRFIMIARKDGLSFLPLPAPGTRMRTVEEAFSRIDYKKDPLARAHFTSPAMARKIKNLKPGEEFGWNGQRRLDPKRPSPTIVAATGILHAHPRANRQLTVREVAELFDVPKNWKFVGSPRRMVSCLGDAIPIKLGIAVGYALLGKVMRKSNAGAAWFKFDERNNDWTVEEMNSDLNPSL